MTSEAGSPSPSRPGAAGRAPDRSRRGRHRRDHELHEHVEPERDDRRRARREEGGRARADAQAVGEDEPRARLEGRHRVSATSRASTRISISSASTSSATAARPASATAVRCPTTSRAEVEARNLVVASVLSGNRNFEGRIQQQVRANYLASPPLVVAYALAGRMTIDLTTEPIGTDQDGAPVYLRELWPTEREIQETMLTRGHVGDVPEQYADVFSGDERWKTLQVPTGDRFAWEPDSTYIRNPPFFDGHHAADDAAATTSPARACSRCSATASRPITSRRPDRSRRTARRAST